MSCWCQPTALHLPSPSVQAESPTPHHAQAVLKPSHHPAFSAFSFALWLCLTSFWRVLQIARPGEKDEPLVWLNASARQAHRFICTATGPGPPGPQPPLGRPHLKCQLQDARAKAHENKLNHFRRPHLILTASSLLAAFRLSACWYTSSASPIFSASSSACPLRK